ncbi:VanZ family protein [[Clostridium] colinum]|uniref:VanZ family protein n=1 Tax=[Clostridium] colinum TaxID=36835 RepID=UPI002024B39F|nr:VanZ family protein [[Clostridium] colinum]
MQLNLKKIVYLICTVLVVIFIFYNSMQNGTSSSNASAIVLNFINDIIANIGLDFKLEGYFIRKLAHFVEFFIFGFFIMLTFEAFTNKIFSIIGFPLFFAIFIPVIDEYIQIYSNGRSSSVKDVLLDFFGATVGISIVCVYFTIKNKYIKKI